MKLPVGLKTRFTLDGQEITAKDLVGKSGVVTATYTVSNLSTQEVEVPIKSVTGEIVKKKVKAQVPMVVEASTLILMRYGGLNTGSGIGGADGRGNNQVKWIGLPFKPLSKDGSTTFGWAANVTDATIPALLIQVLPVYMPAEDETEPKTPEEKAEKAKKDAAALKGLFPGVTPPNISDGAAAAKAGVQQLMAGLAGFKADSAAAGDPLDKLQTGINNFAKNFGTTLADVSKAVDAQNPDSLAAKLQLIEDKNLATLATKVADLNSKLPAVSQALTDLGANTLTDLATKLTALDTALKNGGTTLTALGQNWPQISQALQGVNAALPGVINVLNTGLPIDCAATAPTATPAAGKIGVGALNKALASRAGGTNYRGHQARQTPAPANPAVGDYYTFPGLTAGAAIWKNADGATTPSWVTTGLPGSSSTCGAAIGAANLVITNSGSTQSIARTLQELQPVLAKLAGIQQLTPANAAQVQGLLTQISGLVSGIEPVLGTAASALPKIAGRRTLAWLNTAWKPTITM
jgi:hypothetical protein